MPFLRSHNSPAALVKLVKDDYAIDDTTALLYSAEAPLKPESGKKDAQAVWAREPDGQYADPQRLEKLIGDCLAHLSALRRPGGGTYLVTVSVKDLKRVYVCGHSGAGLPLQETAVSKLILPGPTGLPSDLWLFDSTYWSKIDRIPLPNSGGRSVG